MGRALAFVALLLAVAGFALLNWGAFTAPTAISLGVATVQAPLGLLMLGLVALLCVLFAVWVIALQGTALLDARRQTKALQAQRELADSAEASRLAELRAELLTRLDRLQDESRLALEQHANSLAAQIGELEDRLARSAVLPPSR